MSSLLLVEDDNSLGATLKERLIKDGYQVHWARNVSEAEELAKSKELALMIVDVMLPDGSGFDLVERVKRVRSVPIIFLTAMSGPEYRLKGYELGACEYIPKPFHLKELLLLVKRNLPKSSEAEKIEQSYHVAGVKIDFEGMALRFDDGRTEFPAPKDFKLLRLLIESSPRILERSEILNAIWKGEDLSNSRTVDNAVVRLRQLLKPVNADFIRSVRGIGYQWLEG